VNLGLEAHNPLKPVLCSVAPQTPTIKNGSVISWAHVNMRGEYNFSKAANATPFNVDEILALK
jgi:hypothetical protein